MKETMKRLARHKKFIVIATVALLCVAGIATCVLAAAKKTCGEVWGTYTAEYAEECRSKQQAPDITEAESLKGSPGDEEYIFAGWYHEIPEDGEDKTVGYSEFVSGRKYYAKFLPKHMLTMKAQVSGYLLDNVDVKVDDTDIGNIDAEILKKATIRFVASIDNLHYKKIGFKVSYGNKVVEYETKTVYRQLAALSADPTKTVALSDPQNNFCNLAEFFMTCSVRNVPEKYYNLDFEAVPFWVTKDGVKVYGTPTDEITQVKTIEQGVKREVAWIDPVNGNDIAWAGTRLRPYRTLEYAEQQADETRANTQQIFIKDAFVTEKTDERDSITYSSLGEDATKEEGYYNQLNTSWGQKSVKAFVDSADYRLYPESQVTLTSKGHTEEAMRYREYGLVTEDYQVTDTTPKKRYRKQLPIKYTQKYACSILSVDGEDNLKLDSLGTTKLAQKGKGTAEDKLRYDVKATFTKAPISEANGWNVEGQHFGNIRAVKMSALNEDLTSGRVYTVDNSRMLQAKAKAQSLTDPYQLVLGFRYDTNNDGKFESGEKDTAFRLTYESGKWRVQSYGDNSVYNWITIYVFQDTEEDNAILNKLVTEGVDFKVVRQGRTIRIFVDGKEVTTEKNLQTGSNDTIKKQGYIDAGTDRNGEITGILSTTDAQGYYIYNINKNAVEKAEYNFAIKTDGASIDVRKYEHGKITVDKNSYAYDFSGESDHEEVDITASADRGYAPEKVSIGQYVYKDATELIVEPDGTVLKEDGEKHTANFESQIIGSKFIRSLFWDAIEDNSDWQLLGQYYGKLGVKIPEGGKSSWLVTEGDTYTYVKMGLDGSQQEAWIRLRYTTSDIVTLKLVGNKLYFVGSADGATLSNVRTNTVEIATLSDGTGTDFSVETAKGGTIKVTLGGVSHTINLLQYVLESARVERMKENPCAQISMMVKAPAGTNLTFPFELGNVDIDIQVDPINGSVTYENVTNPGQKIKIGDKVKLTILMNEGRSFDYFMINDEMVYADLDMNEAVSYEFVARVPIYAITTRFVETPIVFEQGTKNANQSPDDYDLSWEVNKDFGYMSTMGVNNPDQTATTKTLLKTLKTVGEKYTRVKVQARDDDPKADGFAIQVGFEFNNGEKFSVRLDNDAFNWNPDHYQIQVMAEDTNTFTTITNESGKEEAQWGYFEDYPLTAKEIEKVRSTEGIEFEVVYNKETREVKVYLDGDPEARATYSLTSKANGTPVKGNMNEAKICLRIDGNEKKMINARYYLGGNVTIEKKFDQSKGTLEVIAVNDKESVEKYSIGDDVTIQAKGTGSNRLSKLTWDGMEVKDINGDGSYTFTITKEKHTVGAEFEGNNLFWTWGEQNQSTWDVTAEQMGVLRVKRLPYTSTNTVTGNTINGTETEWIYASGNNQGIAATAKYNPSLRGNYYDYQLTLAMHFRKDQVNDEFEEVAYRLVLQDDKDSESKSENHSRKWMVQSYNNKDTGWDEIAYLTEEEVRAVQGHGLEFMMRRNGSKVELFLDPTPGVDGDEREVLTRDLAAEGSSYTVTATDAVRSIGIRLSFADNKTVDVPYRILGGAANVYIDQPEEMNDKDDSWKILVPEGNFDVGDEMTLTLPTHTNRDNVGPYYDSLMVYGEPIEIGADGKAKFKIMEKNTIIYATATDESAFETEGTRMNSDEDLTLNQLGILRVNNTSNTPNGGVMYMKERFEVGDTISAKAICPVVDSDGAFGLYIALGFGEEREILFRIANNKANNDVDAWLLQSFRQVNNSADGSGWHQFGETLTSQSDVIQKLKTEGVEISVKRTAEDKVQFMLDGVVVQHKEQQEYPLKEHVFASEVDFSKPVSVGFRLDGNITGSPTYIQYSRSFKASADYAWVGYPATEIDTTLFKWQEKDVTYTTSNTDLISIADGKITAKKAGTATVTATYGNETCTFTVNVKSVDKNSSSYTLSDEKKKAATTHANTWNTKGMNGSTTVLIGDSFFDPAHFTNFDTLYANKDVLALGVDDTKSFVWETYLGTSSDGFLRKTNPKNIVVSLGSIQATEKDVATRACAFEELQKMFYEMHRVLPDAKIYWCTIIERQDTQFGGIYCNADILDLNSKMKNWCEKRSWISCIDVAPDINDSIDTYLNTDMINVQATAYKDVYKPMIDEAVAINDLTGQFEFLQGDPDKNYTGEYITGEYRQSGSTLVLNPGTGYRSRVFLMDGENAYQGDFVISGTAQLVRDDTKMWAMTELHVANQKANRWFINDVALSSCITETSTGITKIWGFETNEKSENFKKAFTDVDESTWTYDFKVILSDGKLLYKVNDSVITFTDVTSNMFAFGSEHAAMKVTNLKIVMNDDPAVAKAMSEEFMADDLTAWVDMSGKIEYPGSEIDFNLPEGMNKQGITFSGYDKTLIEIDDSKQTVKALKAGTTVVTAKKGNLETKFRVTCEEVDTSDSKFSASGVTGGENTYKTRVAYYEKQWKQAGVNESSTVFIGDSFYDQMENNRWNSFYLDNAGYDAFCFGLGGSKSQTWETYVDSWMKEWDIQPKNIVINIGTNNKQETEVLTKELQRLFYLLHDRMPDAHIYWTCMVERGDVADSTSLNTQNKATNANIKEWCSKRDWITFVDMSYVTMSDLGSDKLHPTPKTYVDKYLQSLKAAGLEMNPTLFKVYNKTNDTNTKDQKIFMGYKDGTTSFSFHPGEGERTRAFLMDGTTVYKGDFMVSGTLTMTYDNMTDKNGPRAELFVTDQEGDYWYHEAQNSYSTIVHSTGTVEIWHANQSARHEDFTTTSENTINFTVIKSGGKVLFKVNGVIKEYETTCNMFAFGIDDAVMDVTNLKILTHNKEAIADAYAEAKTAK